MDRRDHVVQLLQFVHILACFILLFFLGLGLFLKYKEIVFEIDSNPFVRKITKISVGFLIGIIISHVIPYFFFWRPIKKNRARKKLMKFFQGSVWQLALLVGLSACLLVVFIVYPHILVVAFFTALFVIILAKRPTHFRLLDKTKFANEDLVTKEV